MNIIIMFTAYLGPKRTTSDGFDYTFQVNFLGYFLLTSLLCRALAPKPSRPLRVVNMASHSYADGRLEDLEDLSEDSPRGTSRPYQQYRTYAASKLAVVMYTAQLALRQGPSVIAVAVHPGKGSPCPQHVWCLMLCDSVGGLSPWQDRHFETIYPCC